MSDYITRNEFIDLVVGHLEKKGYKDARGLAERTMDDFLAGEKIEYGDPRYEYWTADGAYEFYGDFFLYV